MPDSPDPIRSPEMNRELWENVSGDYSRRVLSVFENDKKGKVAKCIKAFAETHPQASAADLGCGIGQFTPTLARSFETVVACDLSAGGVQATRRHCSDFSNVEFLRLDLSEDPMPFAPVDFALCVNVLIMPILDERLRAWRCVTNQVSSGGSLLLVVPSLESIQMDLIQRVDGYIDLGHSCEEALRAGQSSRATASDLQQGIHRLDGLPTKHYFAAELEYLLESHEFDIEEMQKIEYKSSQHVDSWDWLVRAVRR
ncbi:class I SAM-dependent methyltransferase [Pelagicoccus sp. SDUM812002]|uniref:class I SAM-dependent methyltransferase n=1 Tax=Pelagicoccus sp. SDUM812002 TaxID=3041266 RepID=UPI00280F5C60|nr:class I SAM-dependent methyltransferase [Pelagicoccus sp. SDUM812002]MDQ8184362.1 class I SAM-dependent methyltransferase [Pelagicoccus sp. SDUM812002]